MSSSSALKIFQIEGTKKVVLLLMINVMEEKKIPAHKRTEVAGILQPETIDNNNYKYVQISIITIIKALQSATSNADKIAYTI